MSKIDEAKVGKYIRFDCMADPLMRPFYKKLDEWNNKSSPAWKELMHLLQKAQNGDFK